ncbi:General transcription factor 3C polypeptide 1 [Eufriesea mexicana]|uniref:General transcription factor 3C polypeptide 1 n=1 Tax=Eufriesea mexicana TaxID=516756 RepID=A0A310SHJ0_9HYME|nr:PREDICTED: general transcription factor 3C polypeptide 1 [Eufriesea mexicana]OAD53659.1 General transcription factor 3C polypeptide 1 [Eufriesea mexicana]
MVSYPSINIVDSIIDEVALEGLDGITIEALWLRLAHRLHNPIPFSKPFMIQIWSVCVQIRELEFYELETTRESLVIFDRYQFVDPDLGIILEPENVPPDIYPHCPVHDVVNDIKGSCSTYYTRKDITRLVRNFSLDEAIEKYGQKLVIVASQSARNHALMGDEVSPILELNVIQYCFLERVGRSRYHGEVTQGKLSLNALKEDPKSLFYHRKFLLRHKLITKQIHHQKSGSYSCNGSLLHLPRFFVERKPKIIFLAEEVIKILKSKPNCVAEYDEIKRKLQIENAIKKLFKTSFFQKVVKTDIRVPYRTLYPNATPVEWQQKNNPTKEKKIKVVQLLSPNIDILEAWNKDEIQEEDELQELNISNHKYGVPYLKQANTIIEANKIDGVCQGSLAKIMGLTKLQSRTILRNIVKTNIVATYMNDIGRQRLTKYVSKKYEKASKLSKQFNKEMHKIKELTKQITTESNGLEKAKIDIEENKNAIINNKEESVETISKCNIVDKDNLVENESKTTTIELQKIFYIVNRILYKYHVTKRPNRYKCTFSNYLSSKINKIEVKEENSYSNNTLLEISELSKNEKAVAAYKNIKVDLTVLKPTNKTKSENEVYGFMEDVQNIEKKSVTNITYRLLRRANMIIESVKEHQVIDDMTKLMKMIHEEEDKEGYDVKIDKKSLIRLLQKLAKDNLVKHIKITLSGSGKEKHLTFICDPNIDIKSGVIQSAVEQAKLKFYLVASQKPKSSMKPKFEPNKSLKSENDKSSSQQSIMVPSSFKCGPRISRKYGYSPKFLRMQALHIFLFYLVYEHPGEQTFSKTEQIKLLRSNDFNITEELVEEFSTIYTKTVSWKMFVPPLPQYNGWPKGWTLMCDVLLRLPLSIFLKIHYISFSIPEMDKYINHPIRKHYLVRDLPVDIRNSLLYARKYIFHIHETVTRLCYIGLVQFGPQKLKEKDQVFIYVNRHTELMDTTSSAPSYHIIEDKSYPIIKYNFVEIQVVEKYWYDMWNTCINTPLGGRLVVQGKDIVLEDLNKKADMIQAVVARSPEEAVKLDTGKVPGDRKGAAGIDSACFAHLKRNWNWGFSSSGVRQTKKEQNVIYERDMYLAKIKAKPIRFTEFSGLKTVSGPLSLSATEFRKKVQTKNTEGLDQQNKYEALTCQRSTKQKSYVRRVLPRKCSNKRRTKYDEIDYRALQRMHKLRVDWEPYEDKILLICKVAMVYLCPNPRKQVITFSAVRDVLRTYSYTSHNKTSRACQRRLLYMLRQQRNVNTVALGVEELKQNFFLKKRFGGIVEKLKEEHKNPHEYEKQVTEAFKSLIAYIAKKYYDISDVGSKEPLPVPMTVQEFNLFYKVVHPTKPFYNRGFTKDIRNINDIHSAVINSVIHSSMCCGKDRRSWAYQLFKVYQQYPEMLLRNAMAKIRSDQMVTIKKNQLTNIRKYGNYMPMSSSQYQLSSNYIYKFHTKWPYGIFKESYDVFLQLSNWYCHNQMNDKGNASDKCNGVEILTITGGLIGAIHDYIVRDQIDFDIEIPDQVIMLDPRLKEKDETYFRIAKRYQDVLASLDNLKFIKESSLQTSSAVTNIEEHGDKCLNSEVDILHYNDIHNTYGKSDRDGFSDLDAEKNILLSENEGERRSFRDVKHFTDSDELNFDTDEENGRNVVDDEQNIIKFQDGTKIVLNKDDVERATLYDDDSMMEIEEGKTYTVDSISTIDSAVQEKSIDEDSNKVSKFQSIIQVKHNHVSISENTNNKHEDNILNTERTSPSNLYIGSSVNKEDKLIISGRKRQRDNDEQTLDPDESVQKKKKSDHKVQTEKNEENIQNDFSILIETSNKTQNEDSRKHSNNEKMIINDAKSTNNMECEISLQPKKSSEHTFTRISDILRTIPTEQSYLNSYCKIDDSDVHKRYTRIALLRMREELNELTVADSHHAHEYFVVNMFKVFYSLCQLKSLNIRENENFKGLPVPSDLLPLRLSTANNLIQEINKSAVFPKEGISYSDFKKNLSTNFSLNLNNMEAVYRFVRDKKELGVSIKELIDEFEDTLGEDLYRIVSFLADNYIFLRSGVTTVRYIHHRHADAWLIHSYKICRLEKESLIPIPKGTVYVMNSKDTLNKDNGINTIKEPNKSLSSPLENESLKTVCENMIEENIQSEIKDNENKNEDSNKDISSHSDEEYNTQVKKRMQRKRTRLLPQKDISRAAKQLDLNTKQEIKVAIKPWIRIDGILNRRVLDRMLGSILSYCLTRPGIALTKIQNRFVPPLQPCHTRELVEILVKLKCLEKILLKKSRVTLFSKPSQVKLKVANNDWATEEDIFLEPTSGAILKFGIFLSTKMYSTDFIT